MSFRPPAHSRSFATLLASLVFSWCVCAQTPAQLTLTAVNFTGLERYTVQQATIASQLRTGSAVTIAQIQSASDRLAQSGVFDKISFQYATRGSEIAVEFQVTETKSPLPCVFDNFVWFSTDEIDRTLRSRVPLYDGTVPERGTTNRETAEALQAMLHANGINATVDGLPTVVQGKVANFAYRASGVALPVRSIRFPGATGVSESELQEAAKELMDKDYSATDTQYVSSLTLLIIYHRHGYLQARFGQPQAAVTASKGSGTEYDIALTLPVSEGVQYSWDHASWAGNGRFSPAELTSLLAMKQHEVANQDKINAGLRAILTAYSKQGFIDATIQPTVSLDASTRMVAYDSSVDEGIQYKMGQLHISGLSDKTAAELLKKWPMKPGQLFEGTYPDEFLKKVVYPKIAEPGKAPPGVQQQLRRDKENATVDLNLAFR
jgi:outer membrane protein assembly factor BamA